MPRLDGGAPLTTTGFIDQWTRLVVSAHCLRAQSAPVFVSSFGVVASGTSFLMTGPLLQLTIASGFECSRQTP
jgi:hypothetical protein